MSAANLQFVSFGGPFIDMPVQTKRSSHVPLNPNVTTGPAPVDFRTQLERTLGPQTRVPEQPGPQRPQTEVVRPPEPPDWLAGFVQTIMTANPDMTEAQARRIALTQLRGQIAYAAAHPMPGTWEAFGGQFVNGRFVGQTDGTGKLVRTPDQILNA